MAALAVIGNNASSVGSAGPEFLSPSVDPLTAATASSAAAKMRPGLNALTAARRAAAQLTNSGNVTGAKQLANLRAIAQAKANAAVALREAANSTEEQRKAARNAAKRAIKNYANLNVSSVIPINFKGDGFGRTAGYGYKFNKNKTFGNFAHGFPFKYYRVYGNSTNNVTQKIKNVQKMLKNIQNAKEAVNEATVAAKAQAREEQKALKAQQALLNQQQKNLFLAEREMTRAGRGAVLSGAIDPARLEKLQNLAVEEMKLRITGVLKGTVAPANQYENMLATRYKIFKVFERLPPEIKDYLIKLTKKTVSSKARAGLLTTAGRKVGRAYNVASYYTSGRPAASKEFENVFLQGTNTGPAPLSQNFTVKSNSVPWYKKLFTRKNKGTKAAQQGAL